MKKKIKKPKSRVIIIPERKKCECGKKVTDHHWLCNSCHAKKQKHAFWKERIKQVKASRRVNRLKRIKEKETENGY